MKKRIIFIGSVPPPYYGVLVQNQRILNSDFVKEFDVLHLDTSDHRDLKNIGKLDYENIVGGLKHLFALIKKCILFKPHIVYLTLAQNRNAFFRDGLFVLISIFFSGASIIAHFRGGNYKNFYLKSGYLFKMFMRLIYSKIEFGIVLGEKLKNMISEWFENSHIFVIPNGTNFNPDIKLRNTNKTNITLGYISFIAPEKGFNEALDAFILLKKKYNNIQFVVAGEFSSDNDDYKNSILNKIHVNKLSNDINFLGNIIGTDKEKFYLNTDILIFSSWVEGHPNVVIEAMAAGCPIVATDVGAVSESIRNGINGYLILPKDFNFLAEKLEKLINDSDLRKEMSKNAKMIFEEKFTSERNINSLINAFKQAVAYS